MGTQIAPSILPVTVTESRTSEGHELSRLGEGLVTGLIGAAAIAGFFFVVDLSRGQPLHTPTILGTALLRGPAAVARPETISVSIAMITFFTLVHFLVFAAIGVLASSLVRLGERYPDASYGALVVIIMALYGLEAACTVFAGEVVGALGAGQFFAANLLAMLGMCGFLWYRHPRFTVVTD
jgi:hypothetical protein